MTVWLPEFFSYPLLPQNCLKIIIYRENRILGQHTMPDQPLATRWTGHTRLPSPAGTSMLGFVLTPRRHREVTKMYADLRTFLSLKESKFWRPRTGLFCDGSVTSRDDDSLKCPVARDISLTEATLIKRQNSAFCSYFFVSTFP